MAKTSPTVTSRLSALDRSASTLMCGAPGRAWVVEDAALVLLTVEDMLVDPGWPFVGSVQPGKEAWRLAFCRTGRAGLCVAVPVRAT